jgi:phenylalanyl-tRNA synthetase beta subunit
MQISLRWINELINLERTELDDLIDKLTLGGFEVEDVLDVKVTKDHVTALEVSSTANRSDSLSIQGISLEMAALLNQTPKKLAYTVLILSKDFKKFINVLILLRILKNHHQNLKYFIYFIYFINY